MTLHRGQSLLALCNRRLVETHHNQSIRRATRLQQRHERLDNRNPCFEFNQEALPSWQVFEYFFQQRDPLPTPLRVAPTADIKRPQLVKTCIRDNNLSPCHLL